MHLVEQYALSCGVKIDKPFVETAFFPLPFDKYIIIHPSSGMPAKNYDYFQDVIDLIYPYLQKNDIHIVQIGSKKDTALDNCYHLQGTTKLNQTFFLIKNSLLVAGNDSFSSHVASGFNKKIVSLYSNSPKECCGPYWGDKDQQLLLQSTPIGPKPSFSPNESPKSVNNICSWEISRSILSLLNIKFSDLSKKTFYSGSSYWNRALEVIPNFYSDVKVGGFPDSVNIRLDYRESITDLKHLLSNTLKWMSGRPVHLILRDEIDLNLFQPFLSGLQKISYSLSTRTNKDYVQTLKRTGKPLSFFCSDPEEIDEVQLMFLDCGVTLPPQGIKKDLDFDLSLCDNAFYKTSKMILSDNKIYSSLAYLEKGIEFSEEENIIDSPLFWKEIEYFKLYHNTDA